MVMREMSAGPGRLRLRFKASHRIGSFGVSHHRPSPWTQAAVKDGDGDEEQPAQAQRKGKKRR